VHLQDKWGTPLWRRQQLLFGALGDLANEIISLSFFFTRCVGKERSQVIFEKTTKLFFFFL
jgi:hypothetical protein